MHALEVIIRRNEEAAGREAAHADNNGKYEKATAILAATEVDDAFVEGYTRGRAEG